MLKKTIFGLCLLLSFFSFGQESVKGTAELNELVLSEKNGKVRVDAEKMATFPLGSIAFQNMISKNFKMKNVVTNNAEQISCELIFIIDTEGSMIDIKAIGSNESFNKEGIRAISKIKQKWIPAEINGQKVPYRFKIPLAVRFDKKDIN
ncbi:energy transducer TonB [Chryseobacterium sp. RG1]|uniref:Energy transducer TonB n=1 Tax=Chryseobacterium tagetis TaxID=2801334 RepID=A0ABS8A0U5_9FLAO|nr:energy transducer TonB [Chryseobacterium tagetis]MCA6067053.1 energy transducer TonB [Chryseobacterium tagetis]